jgi:hypothetical protein
MYIGVAAVLAHPKAAVHQEVAFDEDELVMGESFVKKISSYPSQGEECQMNNKYTVFIYSSFVQASIRLHVVVRPCGDTNAQKGLLVQIFYFYE